MTSDISITDIIIPTDYDVTTESFLALKDSIRKNGMFHAPILQGDKAPYKIIAGRARILALLELFKTYGDDSALYSITTATILPSSCPNPLEISLHENLRRNNLPWYDQVELERELHELRITEHGKKPGGRYSNNVAPTAWTQKDTADELGISIGSFSQDINLASAIQRNPHLRNVKDKTTAIRLVRQMATREINELEQLMPSDIELNQVLLGDSAEILRSFPKETFDACITDPPWSEYKDENLRSDQEKLLPIFLELYRVLKPNSFLYVITSTTDFYFYKRELPKLGFKIQSYPILWQKPRTITHGRRPWEYARDYEPIIVAVKGDPLLTCPTERSSILNYDNLHYTRMIHPHEKPLGLIEELINNCTYSGGKIVDPFAGSGVTLHAAKNLGRAFIGIEMNRDFYENIVKRLAKEEEKA